MQNEVFVVTGPTASGKSKVGIELAKKINGVVISADSMQIYKGLDIGTAKVTIKEAKGIEHKLIDIAEIDEKFSVSEFKKRCYEAIDNILKSGKTPIIVGGTGLYINAVVNNMQFEEIDEKTQREIKQKLELLIDGKSDKEIYDILKSMDYESARNIEPGNKKRILRAIELNLLGIKKSNIQMRDDLWNKNESPYIFNVCYIDMPRDMLYDRIDKRVDQMVDLGVLNEVKILYGKKDLPITAVQAIGYKEFFPYVEKTATLEECTKTLKQKTRNYAKRQVTWFKKLTDKLVLDGTKPACDIVEDILKEYYEKD